MMPYAIWLFLMTFCPHFMPLDAEATQPGVPHGHPPPTCDCGPK